METLTPTYDDLLDSLATKLPNTADFLRRAHECRQAKLGEYLGGARLLGIESLVNHLRLVHSRFSSDPQLRKIAFLIERSSAEFLVAVEASLSGFHTVAHDAMRSVMEIEFLVRDFYLDPLRIDDWITADEKSIRRTYSPAELRERWAASLGVEKKDLCEATDYRGHSMFLHVGPRQHPFGLSGFSNDPSGFTVDSCFWEIFEHGQRLLRSIHGLAKKVAPTMFEGHDWTPIQPFSDAWERTREMHQIWREMIGYRQTPKVKDQ